VKKPVSDRRGTTGLPARPTPPLHYSEPPITPLSAASPNSTTPDAKKHTHTHTHRVQTRPERQRAYAARIRVGVHSCFDGSGWEG
jgi:hypothetical protein